MRSNRLQQLVGRVIVAFVAGSAVSAALAQQIIYEEDFSQDPSWITNNGNNYYWTGSEFFTRQVNGSEEYAYRRLATLDGDQFLRLEVDVKPGRYDWAADGYVGFFDPDMCSEAPACVFIHPARPDGGQLFHLDYRDRDGGYGHVAFAPFTLDTWYSTSFEYDPIGQTLVGSVIERDTGRLVGSCRFEGVGSFSGIDRVATLTVCHDYASGNGGETLFDNLRVWQGSGGIQLVADGTCPGGGPIRIEWSGATPNGQAALVFATSQGNYIVPARLPCQGTQLGLGASQIQVAWTGRSDNSGSKVLNSTAGAGACDKFLQLLDLTTCATSNVATIE